MYLMSGNNLPIRLQPAYACGMMGWSKMINLIIYGLIIMFFLNE